MVRDPYAYGDLELLSTASWFIGLSFPVFSPSVADGSRSENFLSPKDFAVYFHVSFRLSRFSPSKTTQNSSPP